MAGRKQQEQLHTAGCSSCELARLSPNFATLLRACVKRLIKPKLLQLPSLQALSRPAYSLQISPRTAVLLALYPFRPNTRRRGEKDFRRHNLWQTFRTLLLGCKRAL